MSVGGLYISWRIRQMVLPFVRVYGQWVEEHIIPMSEQLQTMADKVEAEAYEELLSAPVGDDYMGDGSEEAQEANDIGLSFYENVSSMYQTTLNLFSAGLFHVVEQQLADITRDGGIRKPVSNTYLKDVVEWYAKNCQLDLTQFPSWSVIEELRLVANTTKHAEGPAAKQLREKHAELFLYPPLRKEYADKTVYVSPLSLPLGGDGLYVTADEFRIYHKTALDFFEWLNQYFEDHGNEHFPR
jgi:hypothetical protein